MSSIKSVFPIHTLCAHTYLIHVSLKLIFASLRKALNEGLTSDRRLHNHFLKVWHDVFHKNSLNGLELLFLSQVFILESIAQSRLLLLY